LSPAPDRAPPWAHLSADERAFTMDDVRQACRSLPAPGLRPIDHYFDEPTLAATAVPVTDVDGLAAVVLTQRAATMTRNRGDWVFPGGRVDPADATSAGAAAREATEELGLAPGAVEMLGQLDTHGPIMTGFLVDTFVVAVEPTARFAPPPEEVSAVTVVPLAHFTADGSFAADRPLPQFQPGMTADGTPLVVPATPGARANVRSLSSFALPSGELVWGLQAEILVNLLEVLVSARRRGWRRSW
jgi:8-oxo-dGTP pyrophosphatase MutT (NUDIX family)